MTQQPKKNEVFGAISDLIILVLLVGGAAFGGYFYGTHQRMAPIKDVPPGTPGAIEVAATSTPAPATATAPAPAPATKETEPAKHEETKEAAAPGKDAKKGKTKYWLSSSGEDYIGYSITAKVNGTPVDSFYGAGKNLNISNLVKKGENKITFEAKALGDEYNKHEGDAAAALVLDVVSGPSITDDYAKSDVLATYKRTATENGDFTDTVTFTGK